jgi:dihydroorotate dehydrogenase
MFELNVETLAKFGMTNPETLSKLDSFARPIASKILSPEKFISLYSKGRLTFLEILANNPPEESYVPDEKNKIKMWGIEFNNRTFNAAGMFKHGEGYETVAKMGAGAYLGGTSTALQRKGNTKNNIKWPFAPYYYSDAASNNMGLPNDGDEINAERVSKIEKIKGCPVGWSFAIMPDVDELYALENLVTGMILFVRAGVDFIEINESCPNTGQEIGQENGLYRRLSYISEHFLKHRERFVPVILKFSNDTKPTQVPEIIDMLGCLGYDGVNFGNTSKDYAKRRKFIDKRDLKLYDYFTENFGGGVSGKPLKESSLELGSIAAEYLKEGKFRQEFHVWRTGGVDSDKDVKESTAAGISANQWFTGFMKAYAKDGPKAYEKTFN